jgi:hypothetical protein
MRRLLCERCGKIKGVSKFSQLMVDIAEEYDADFASACRECEEVERKRLQKAAEEV